MKSRWECCVGVTQVIHFYLSFTPRRQTRLNTSANLRQQEGETNTSQHLQVWVAVFHFYALTITRQQNQTSTGFEKKIQRTSRRQRAHCTQIRGTYMWPHLLCTNSRAIVCCSHPMVSSVTHTHMHTDYTFFFKDGTIKCYLNYPI